MAVAGIRLVQRPAEGDGVAVTLLHDVQPQQERPRQVAAESSGFGGAPEMMNGVFGALQGGPAQQALHQRRYAVADEVQHAQSQVSVAHGLVGEE